MTRTEFGHIETTLQQKVLTICSKFFHSKEDVEDAVQEAMVQLWLYCEHIDVRRNVDALAVKVAKNCCVNLYRKKQRQPYVAYTDTEAWCQIRSDDTPQEQLEAKDTCRMLAETMDLLKPRERQLFEMRAVLGLSTEEVAEQTGIPRASVVAMVSAARKKVFIELQRRMRQ